MTSLLNLDLLWVTGKGGVGKTSTAAAIAEVAARSGRSTLVCEMDAKGALALALGVDELDFTPVEVAPNLHAMSMSTEDALREYLRLFVRIPFIGRIGPLAKTFDFVADAAPGVKEKAVSGACGPKGARGWVCLRGLLYRLRRKRQTLDQSLGLKRIVEVLPNLGTKV